MTATRDIGYEESVMIELDDPLPYSTWTNMWYNRCILQMNRGFSNDIEMGHASANFKLYYGIYVLTHKKEYGNLVKLSHQHIFCWKCEEGIYHV